jgi:hypothetical protein
MNQNNMNMSTINNINMNRNQNNMNINTMNNMNQNQIQNNMNNMNMNRNINQKTMMSMSVMPQIINNQNINNPQNKMNMNIISQNQNKNQISNMIQNMSSQISKISLQNPQPQIQNNQNIQNRNQQNQKQRLFLKMTNEERGTFSTLFQMADKENKGRLPAKDAADFLKRSNLPKEILKQIWIISAQTNFQFLEKDEFYIALRLVALAQNNFPVNAESIRNNYPLPPLPTFDLKKKNVIEDDSFFELNEQEKIKYKRFFDINKDSGDKINLNKTFQMWKSANFNEDTIKKIISLVQPFLNDNNNLNLKEFQVCTDLGFKSANTELLSKLPEYLSKNLKGEDFKKKSNEMDLGLN